VLTGFFHTGLVVRDLERMVRFYTETLGLQVEQEIDSIAPPTGDHTGLPGARRKLVFLGFGGGHQIELVYYLEPESPEGGSDRHQLGGMHICFDVENLIETCEKVKSQGVEFLTEPKFSTTPSGQRVGVVYLQDPEGNWLEFVERTQIPG
jgi:catechol 2,3-dioxygenase-like lactoylglutathione lyase family enzyme